MSSNNHLTVYLHRYSFYSQKVLMALHEKGARFKIESVNIAAGEQYRPEFLALNPKGEVPVLRDGERIIPDSARIIAYLEERSEAENWPRLIPTPESDSPEVVELHRELHEAIHSLPADVITIGSFYHQDLLVRRPKLPFLLPTRIHMKNITERVVDKLRRLSSELPAWKDALLTKATRLEGDLALMKNKAEFQKVLTRLDEVLDQAEQRLASPNRSKEEWLVRKDLSLSDIDLTILLERLNVLGLEDHFLRKPQLTAFWERVRRRESYKKTTPSNFFHLVTFLRAPLYLQLF